MASPLIIKTCYLSARHLHHQQQHHHHHCSFLFSTASPLNLPSFIPSNPSRWKVLMKLRKKLKRT
ncbi:hypothetical protein OIU76_026429 [Salix suchowensis]|nr:hypothetical protein OIU76_026429 [Salix suchowensis]